MAHCVVSRAEIERRQTAGERLGEAMKRYLRLLARGDADVCSYCAVELTDDNRTIDHRTSLVRGGSNDLKNLCLACKPCNSRKGAMSADEFMWFLDQPTWLQPTPEPSILAVRTVAPSLGVKSRKRSSVPVMSLLSAESRYALVELPRQWAGEWTPPYRPARSDWR